MDRKHLLGVVYLSLATFLWGSTFVIIKDSLSNLSSAQLIFTRFVLGSLAFLPFIFVRNRKLWAAGLELGAYLFICYLAQTIGLGYTTASRSAFITTLYVVLLPILLGLLGQRLGWNIWASAGMAIVGVGLLSYDGSPPNVGDLWTLLTALSYTVYIWRMEQFAAKFPSLPLTGIQILTVLLGSAIWVSLERPVWHWESFPWLSVAYLGLVASAFCIWLQALGQKTVPAPEASIIYALEPVYAAVLAVLILKEHLGLQGIAGAVLIVLATLVSQLRSKKPHPEHLGPETNVNPDTPQALDKE